MREFRAHQGGRETALGAQILCAEEQGFSRYRPATEVQRCSSCSFSQGIHELATSHFSCA